MDDNARVVIELADGGDEVVSARNLYYIRRALDFETWEEPNGSSTAVLGSVKITSKHSANDLAEIFRDYITIVELSAPDNSVLYVQGLAVQDVDNTPSTMPGSNSWLVFGPGPRAARLGVRQTREQLRQIWIDAGLDPNASRI